MFILDETDKTDEVCKEYEKNGISRTRKSEDIRINILLVLIIIHYLYVMINP